MTNSPKFLLKPDSALFIDRDGVINELRPNDYVKQISEFKLLPWVKESLEILRPLFKRIFIVTNQQGIGKKLMIDDIDKIHQYFLSEIPINAKPDKIYYCPHLEIENCICRKPKTGMALMAKSEFPEINLSNSIMIGDSLSDIDFALNSGIKPVYINHNPLNNEIKEIPVFKNLLEFAKYLVENIH